MSEPRRPATPTPAAASAAAPDSTTTIAAGRTGRDARSGVTRWLLSRDAVMIALLVVFVLVACLTLPRFASTVTVGFLLLDVIPVLLLAMPMTLVIVSGEIDLSVASTVGLTSAMMGVLFQGGMDIGLVLVLSVATGVIAGVVNGFLVAVVGLPSLAVTIGTLALFRGLALVIIGDNAVADFPIELTSFFTSKIVPTGIPTVMIGVVVVIAVFAAVLHFSPFGRALYALGYSPEAATFVGVKVRRAKFWLFVASGFIAALVGVYWTLRYSSARSDNATGLELSVIAAVLLGGVSIFGGRGTIPGVVSGVLLIGTINYALRLQRVSDVVLIIVTGALLIASVVGPSLFATLQERLHHRRVRRALPAAP